MSNKRFSSFLLDGEEIVWIGSPRQGFRFRPLDALLVPFALFWCGIIGAWFAMALPKASFFFLLFGLPHLLVGIYLLTGRFLADIRGRKAVRYAITNRRVLISYGHKNPYSFSLSNPPTMELQEGSDGRGTISFGQRGFRENWLSYFLPVRFSAFVGRYFDSIEDARRVFALLTEKDEGRRRELVKKIEVNLLNAEKVGPATAGELPVAVRP